MRLGRPQVGHVSALHDLTSRSAIHTDLDPLGPAVHGFAASGGGGIGGLGRLGTPLPAVFAASGHRGGGGSYAGDTALRAFLGHGAGIGGGGLSGQQQQPQQHQQQQQHRGSGTGPNGIPGRAASNGGGVQSIFGNEVPNRILAKAASAPVRHLTFVLSNRHHEHAKAMRTPSVHLARCIRSCLRVPCPLPQMAAKEAARLYDAAIQQQSLDAFLNPGWLSGGPNGLNSGAPSLGQPGSPMLSSAAASTYRSARCPFRGDDAVNTFSATVGNSERFRIRLGPRTRISTVNPLRQPMPIVNCQQQ